MKDRLEVLMIQLQWEEGGAISFRYTGLIGDSSNQMKLFCLIYRLYLRRDEDKTRIKIEIENSTLISKYGFRYAGTQVQRVN